jgi:hypothetical protein
VNGVLEMFKVASQQDFAAGRDTLVQPAAEAG